MPPGTRSQAERDEATVEIGYALLSGCFLGAVAFGALAGPALVWHLPPAVDTSLVFAGSVAAGALAVARVVHVLRRYARHEG
ncbi:DUF6332 family protein [Actinacidiphila paucisporea]|uniref:Uncharacterized protein n=1 Tax=Actinacidiphila paucisporea TaxID=310782 RepID=A0A1M7NS10_9ACTN|nr:DUF6332 family protein [Actinacidiphila paucisporea]SHN06241.1 hypothetical protein SAMN05216499_119114 [Actinacidiphila paucisporea]